MTPLAWRGLMRATRATLERFTRKPLLVGLDGWVGRSNVVVRARAATGLQGASTEAAAKRNPNVSRWTRLSRRGRTLRKRYLARGLGEVEVKVQHGSLTQDATSDAHGMIEARLPRREAEALPAGDHQESCGLARSGARQTAHVALAGSGRPVEVPLYRPGPRAPHLIISDIDDTVLDTELTNPIRRTSQLLLSDRPARVPFPGVGELYHALSHGGAPIFYLSNSPVQLHDHILELFDAHGLPRGPLLLKRSVLPEAPTVWSRQPRHKDRALDALARDFPDLPIVLLGDTSRRDTEHYLRFAERHPGRTEAIYSARVIRTQRKLGPQ